MDSRASVLVPRFENPCPQARSRLQSLSHRLVDLVKSLLGKGGKADFQVRQWGIRRTWKSVVPLNQQAVTRRVTLAYPTENAFFRVAKGCDYALATVDNTSCFTFRSRKASLRDLFDFKTQIELDRKLLPKLFRNMVLELASGFRLIGRFKFQ